MAGVLKMAHQVSVWAKDGNPENGVEVCTEVVHFTGNVPWAMAPCKDKITPDGPSASDSSAAPIQSSAEDDSKAGCRVLILRLDGPGARGDHAFHRSTRRLMGFLVSQAKVDTAYTAEEALEHINNNKPKAIIVADASLTIRQGESGCIPAGDIIMSKIKQFLVDGGNVVFACDFSSADHVDVAPFWRTHFDRAWVWQSCLRTVVDHQPDAVEHFPPNNFLKKLYSVRGNFVSHVDPSEALYKLSADKYPAKKTMDDGDAGGEKADEKKHSVPEGGLTVVAWCKYGKGHFGYVGDENKELATDECVFAMCGFSHLDAKLDNWYPDTSFSVSLGDLDFMLGSR